MLMCGALCQLSHLPGLNLLFSLPQNEGGSDERTANERLLCNWPWLLVSDVYGLQLECDSQKLPFSYHRCLQYITVPCSRLGLGAHSFSSAQEWRETPSLSSERPDSQAQVLAPRQSPNWIGSLLTCVVIPQRFFGPAC